MQDNINRTGSNWTGKYPRSLEEAGLGDWHDPEPPIWKQILLGAAIAGAFLASVGVSYLIVG